MPRTRFRSISAAQCPAGLGLALPLTVSRLRHREALARFGEAILGTIESGKAHPEPSEWRRDEETLCYTFLAPEIAVQLAQECVPVFLRPVGQVGDEASDLLAGSFAERLGAAEKSTA
jgi:hypothetical protein